ncbi:YezD family protein [Bacillus infantis]|nr:MULTISPECIES: YezD family protein [Bacillus]MCA1034980.1 YezD family protein [Bacillus infantis]MCA1038307.1 YezD family protein [Bacillus infantis]MCP1158660.1 YezD family protein [Bacillus infantis]MCR6611107.1 YezD family protein [Bacillus infantis]MDT0163289.1 YezD family protein [Bacillus sp. AG4(2022)]
MKHADWEEVAAHLQRMLQSVKFGSITLVVQDGKVIQIEKNEKVRLQSNKAR